MILNIFEFTEDDLKSNKGGFITPRQREWIDNMAGGIRSSQRGSAAAAIIFPIFGMGIILAMYLSNESSRAALFSNPLNLMVILLTAPLVAGIFGLSIYFANRRANRLSNSPLLKAEGKVRLDESYSSETGGSTYYVIVGRKKFAFAENVSGMFTEGAAYRIHYCETSMLKLILSYERISTPLPVRRFPPIL